MLSHLCMYMYMTLYIAFLHHNQQNACEFDGNAQLSYQLAIGVSLEIFLLMSFALLVVLLTCTVYQKQRRGGMFFSYAHTIAKYMF